MKILKSDELGCSLMVYSCLNMSKIWPFLFNNINSGNILITFFFFVQVNKHFITFHRNAMNRSKHSEEFKFNWSSFRILYKYRNTKKNWSTEPMLPWTGYLIPGTVICSCWISLSRTHRLRRGRLNPDNQNFTGPYLPEQHLLIYFSSNRNHIKSKTGHPTFSDSKKGFQS